MLRLTFYNNLLFNEDNLLEIDVLEDASIRFNLQRIIQKSMSIVIFDFPKKKQHFPVGYWGEMNLFMVARLFLGVWWPHSLKVCE